MSAGILTWLIVGSLALGVLAVVLDRVNFPQRPFKPKRVGSTDPEIGRDRTGAHIIEEDNGDSGGGPGGGV